MPSTHPNRGHGWTGIKRGHKTRPAEWLAEKFIFLVSLSAIVMVFLILLFVAREALPVALGRMSSVKPFKAIPPEEIGRLSQAELMEYLELTPAQFKAMDQATLKELMAVKVEAAAEAPKDKDAAMNTTTWSAMFKPHQWSGYDKPEYIWQPVS